MSVFARLGYDAANTAITNLAPDTVTTMSRMPDILNSWQTTDMGNSDATGYFVNPNATVTQNAWNTANSIIAITGLSSVANMSGVVTATQSLQSAANNFLGHTNRLSGVVAINANTATLPHYSTAVGVSKVVMQIVFQTDGVQNNAPMMGNFTSITCTDTLNSKYSAISAYPTTISNSIQSVSDGLGGYTYTTSLTPSQITTITNNIQVYADFMNARRTSDVSFYNNCMSIANDYNTLKQFSNPGQTETDLLTNHIGSAKLLSRLNS